MNEVNHSTYHHLVQTDLIYVDGKRSIQSKATLLEGPACLNRALLDSNPIDIVDRYVTLAYPRYRSENSEGYLSFIYEVFAAIFDLLFESKKQIDNRLTPYNRGYALASPAKSITYPVNASILPDTFSKASSPLNHSPHDLISSIGKAQAVLLQNQPKKWLSQTASRTPPRNCLEELQGREQHSARLEQLPRRLPPNRFNRPAARNSLPQQANQSAADSNKSPADEQIAPIAKDPHSVMKSNNRLSNAQGTPRAKSEPILLVLDSSLTAEQIERIHAYKLTPVPDLTEAEQTSLTQAAKMTRAVAIRNEPISLKNKMSEIPALLKEIQDLNAEIAKEQEAGKDQSLTIEQMRNLQKLNTIIKDRKSIILKVLFPNEEKEVLVQIPEKEVLALAGKYLICAQERLEELELDRPVIREADAPVHPIVQDPVANALAAAQKNLKNMDGALKTAKSSLIRLDREIPALERQIAEVFNKMQTARGNNDLDALDPLFKKYEEMEPALADKKKSREAVEKKNQLLPPQIEELKTKIEGLEQQLAERSAVQDSSASPLYTEKK